MRLHTTILYGHSSVAIAAAILASACTSIPHVTTDVLDLQATGNLDDEKNAIHLIADSKGIVSIPTGRELTSAERLNIGRQNALLTNYFVREESKYYKCRQGRGVADCAASPLESDKSPSDGWPAGLPRLCLALSGGGVRSAAVSIGLLQSLHSNDLLEKVDVISAVSGGSYALSWLLISEINAAQENASPPTFTRILDDSGEWQRHLEANASIIPKVYGLFAAASGVGGAPLGQKGASNAYWAALYTAFHSGQCFTCMVNGQILLRDLGPLLLSYDLPYPVIGTTARRPPEGPCDRKMEPGSRPLASSFFELTPARQGLRGAYTDSGLALSITDAVALSGAALPDPNSAACPALDAVGLSLHRSIEYKSLSNHDGLVDRRFQISDGGFSDNLAMFPLVQRMCQQIIVLDAEEDPALTFEGLGLLSTALRAQHGFEWIDPLRNRQGDLIGSTGLATERSEFIADMLKDPVFVGSLGNVPIYNRTGKSQSYGLSMLELKVIYAKLSVAGGSSLCDKEDNREFVQYYCKQRLDYELTGKAWRCEPGLLGSCPFPHTRTVKQDFSAADFRAYRSLGMELGRKVAAEVRRDIDFAK